MMNIHNEGIETVCDGCGRWWGAEHLVGGLCPDCRSVPYRKIVEDTPREVHQPGKPGA